MAQSPPDSDGIDPVEGGVLASAAGGAITEFTVGIDRAISVASETATDVLTGVRDMLSGLLPEQVPVAVDVALDVVVHLV